MFATVPVQWCALVHTPTIGWRAVVRNGWTYPYGRDGYVTVKTVEGGDITLHIDTLSLELAGLTDRRAVIHSAGSGTGWTRWGMPTRIPVQFTLGGAVDVGTTVTWHDDSNTVTIDRCIWPDDATSPCRTGLHSVTVPISDVQPLAFDRYFHQLATACVRPVRRPESGSDPPPSPEPEPVPKSSVSNNQIIEEKPMEYTFTNLHQDMFVEVTEGAKAGVAAELCNILVDGVVEAFDDIPYLGVVAGNKLGRAVLCLLVPYAVCALTIVAPHAFPSGSAVVTREVCRYAVRGYSTLAVVPIVSRLKATLRRVTDAAKEQGVVRAEPTP